jgi:hypothetical protein
LLLSLDSIDDDDEDEGEEVDGDSEDEGEGELSSASISMIESSSTLILGSVFFNLLFSRCSS